jgi:hypothetical protein
MGRWKYSSTILDLALNGGERSASYLFCFIPGDTAPDTPYTRGWVGSSLYKEESLLSLLEIDVQFFSYSVLWLSSYIDWAILVPMFWTEIQKLQMDVNTI